MYLYELRRRIESLIGPETWHRAGSPAGPASSATIRWRFIRLYVCACVCVCVCMNARFAYV